jgi:hypothetical protein
MHMTRFIGALLIIGILFGCETLPITSRSPSFPTGAKPIIELPKRIPGFELDDRRSPLSGTPPGAAVVPDEYFGVPIVDLVASHMGQKIFGTPIAIASKSELRLTGFSVFAQPDDEYEALLGWNNYGGTAHIFGRGSPLSSTPPSALYAPRGASFASRAAIDLIAVLMGTLPRSGRLSKQGVAIHALVTASYGGFTYRGKSVRTGSVSHHALLSEQTTAQAISLMADNIVDQKPWLALPSLLDVESPYPYEDDAILSRLKAESAGSSERSSSEADWYQLGKQESSRGFASKSWVRMRGGRWDHAMVFVPHAQLQSDGFATFREKFLRKASWDSAEKRQVGNIRTLHSPLGALQCIEDIGSLVDDPAALHPEGERRIGVRVLHCNQSNNGKQGAQFSIANFELEGVSEQLSGLEVQDKRISEFLAIALGD